MSVLDNDGVPGLNEVFPHLGPSKSRDPGGLASWIPNVPGLVHKFTELISQFKGLIGTVRTSSKEMGLMNQNIELLTEEARCLNSNLDELTGINEKLGTLIDSVDKLTDSTEPLGGLKDEIVSLRNVVSKMVGDE